MKNQDPKDFDRKKLRYYFRRIVNKIEQLPKGHFAFKKMKGICGLCEWDEGIKIDPRRDILPTIIHEVLHDMYPNNWEGWTLRVESKIMTILSPNDCVKLLTAFCKKLDTSSDQTQ